MQISEVNVVGKKQGSRNSKIEKWKGNANFANYFQTYFSN